MHSQLPCWFWVKVSLFRNVFLVSPIIPKNERKNETLLLKYYFASWPQIKLLSFVFGRIQDTEKTFKNWLPFIMCLISFTMNSKSSSKVTLHRKTAKLQKTSLGGKSLLDYVHFNAMVFHYLLLILFYAKPVSMSSETAERSKKSFIAHWY